MRAFVAWCIILVHLALEVYCTGNSLPKRKLDGWTFFQPNVEIVMIRRNYNPPGGPNESMCVTAAFEPELLEEHRLIKVFFYLNMSSTHILPNHTKPMWPIANISMTFSKQENKTGYNTVNSYIIKSWHGYSLSPPKWRFLLNNGSCAVVKVLSASYGNRANVSGKYGTANFGVICTKA
uniref:Uncharacterized protein n=1 Tax=Amblyomma maculatum TaxID=34609 RepID=G3MT51_AMBMU